MKLKKFFVFIALFLSPCSKLCFVQENPIKQDLEKIVTVKKEELLNTFNRYWWQSFTETVKSQFISNALSVFLYKILKQDVNNSFFRQDNSFGMTNSLYFYAPIAYDFASSLFLFHDLSTSIQLPNTLTVSGTTEQYRSFVAQHFVDQLVQDYYNGAGYKQNFGWAFSSSIKLILWGPSALFAPALGRHLLEIPNQDISPSTYRPLILNIPNQTSAYPLPFSWNLSLPNNTECLN